MAGLGRRTHYRKHLTDEVMFGTPEPQINDKIAKIVSTRGSNQFDVLLADSKQCDPVLAILPTKFRKLVWLKRNDFVIVQTASDVHNEEEMQSHESTDVGAALVDDSEQKSQMKNSFESDKKGIRFMISHILYKDQIIHLKSKNMWPTNDDEFNVTTKEIQTPPENFEQNPPETGDDAKVNLSTIIDNDDQPNNEYFNDNDPLLFVNTNRVAKLVIEDSDSSADED